MHEMLAEISVAKIQLPDFQRGWIWDDEHVRSLLASISLSYPIGAVMLLEAGGEGIRFKPRLVSGLGEVDRIPEHLILDGQQRLTALFQSLLSGNAVITRDSRGKAIKRWYYINMAEALDPQVDREDAIFGVPEDRMIRNFRRELQEDYSTPEKEYAAGVFPIHMVFDCADWRFGYNEYWNHDRDKVRAFDHFEREFVKRFEQYDLPLLTLQKETPKEAVCQVFEKVNTGGVSLTVFELLTASFAADDFSLRDDWEIRRERIRNHKVLRRVQNTDLLLAVTLLATRAKRITSIESGAQPSDAPAISCRRKDVLRLTLDGYRDWSEKITDGFERAARLLHRENIFTARDLPYQTQLIPLSAILALLGDEAEADGVRSKLARWYWCGVFGELYGSAVETRFARDVPEVVAWINGGPEPTTVQDANFIPARLLTLRTRNSAAYKGLYSVLIRDGAEDFRTGDPIDIQKYFDDSIDIHHLFPKSWCVKNNIEATVADSIINKTPISAVTNRIIGAKPPSEYVSIVQRRYGIDDDRMDEILSSHVIDTPSFLADDLKVFWEARQEQLLQRIENAMGKPIVRESPVEEDVDDYLEGEEEE